MPSVLESMVVCDRNVSEIIYIPPGTTQLLLGMHDCQTTGRYLSE